LRHVLVARAVPPAAAAVGEDHRPRRPRGQRQHPRQPAPPARDADLPRAPALVCRRHVVLAVRRSSDPGVSTDPSPGVNASGVPNGGRRDHRKLVTVAIGTKLRLASPLSWLVPAPPLSVPVTSMTPSLKSTVSSPEPIRKSRLNRPTTPSAKVTVSPP